MDIISSHRALAACERKKHAPYYLCIRSIINKKSRISTAVVVYYILHYVRIVLGEECIHDTKYSSSTSYVRSGVR